ncbi:hypothetical protein ERJ75_000993100 [Trypanosoma vivax]|nr:hypothetical protein ERJ75_000993100 [Trypanosoma vivax]
MSFRLEQQRHLGRLEDTDKPSTLNVIAKVRPHPTKPTHTGHANPGAQPHKVVPGIPDKHGAKEMSDERLSTSNYGPRASGMCGGSSNLDQQQSERPPAEGRNHQHMHLCHQMGTQFTVRIGGAEVCHTDDIKRVETENCSASRKKYADCFPPHTVIERKIWTNEPYINLRAEKSLTDKRSTQMEPGFINTLTPQPESEQGGAKEQKQYTTPASTVKGRVEHELSPESAVSRQQGSRNGAYRGPVSYSGQPITEQNRKAGVSGGYSSMFNVPSGQNQWQQQPNPPPYYSLQYEHQGSNTGDAAQSTNSKGGNSNASPTDTGGLMSISITLLLQDKGLREDHQCILLLAK